MAKDKKGKSESKKAKLAEKKAKQEKKGERKEKSKKAKANDSDAEDVDLDAVLAEYAKQQEQFLKVTEVASDPPRARGSSTFIASPANTNELFLFGGEYFNGALATFFNDLHIYIIDKDEWRLVTSPNSPLPRSGHAWCRGGNTKDIYLFGGEFSSPKQGTFYHYNDFWKFDPPSREWTRIETKGKSPPARSGHRMTSFKKYIILFGGFQDTSQQTKYLSDLWIYDTQNFTWHTPTFPGSMQKPDARSSFTLLPHDNGAVLFGGYSRVKATVTGKQTKGGGGQAQRNILKPMVHQDCFYLRIVPQSADQPAGALPAVRWERRKKPMNAPNPPRAGATMVYHARRGIAFGGVHDVEESEEGIDSEFFNLLHAWNIERNRFFQMGLRKPRAVRKQVPVNERGGRRGRGQADEEELLRNLAALETGRPLADVDDMVLDLPKPEEVKSEIPVKENSMEFPHPRFNAQLAVQDDVLYIYGGTFEKGDREFTFDDMYAVDLVKLDGVKEIFKREPENWLGEEEGESEDEDEEGSEEEDEDEGSDVEMVDAKPLYTPSKRKGKEKKPDEGAEDQVEAAPAAEAEEEEEETATPSARDDNLPYPRPFESRRDFFQRTSNEWQNILIDKLKMIGEVDNYGIKEIKTKAYKLAEERWWDCREELMQLEEEQEEAGIGEVVSLADRDRTGAEARRR